ncbi:MAG: hypothetical protein N4A44_05020 [Alphaproteobacteria bacterium]|jgi:hypothetical protein|nr:hypothetical protein [Alphaproteobacteria bacterium]
MNSQIEISGNENESPVKFSQVSNEAITELMVKFSKSEDKKVLDFFITGIEENRILCICECKTAKVKELKSISHEQNGKVIGSSHWRTKRNLCPKNFFIKLNGKIFIAEAEGKNLEIKSGNEEIILIAS